MKQALKLGSWFSLWFFFSGQQNFEVSDLAPKTQQVEVPLEWTKATCEKTMGKIRRDQTNLQISCNSSLNTPILLNDVCHELAQSPRWRYYSSAEPLYESHVMKRGPQGIEIAPARTPERFSARKRPGEWTSHENFDFSKFSAIMTWSWCLTSSGATNSFCDLVPLIYYNTMIKFSFSKYSMNLCVKS